ncbi:MAG TPA: hypothetical protein VLI92_01380 [Candidatus Saccharimonadales bacterium]|nr:hypothetical protein [Candidatus Saccharimonadales bacterium]
MPKGDHMVSVHRMWSNKNVVKIVAVLLVLMLLLSVTGAAHANNIDLGKICTEQGGTLVPGDNAYGSMCLINGILYSFDLDYHCHQLFGPLFSAFFKVFDQGNKTWMCLPSVTNDPYLHRFDHP